MSYLNDGVTGLGRRRVYRRRRARGGWSWAGINAGLKSVRPASILKNVLDSSGLTDKLNNSTLGKIGNTLLGTAVNAGYGRRRRRRVGGYALGDGRRRRRVARGGSKAGRTIMIRY